MCGRFTLSKRELGDIAEFLDAEVAAGDAELYRPRYNVAPTDTHFVLERVENRRVLVPATWGLDGGPRGLVVNARAETVAGKRLYSQSLAHHRCVVPTDGFFEWTGPKRERRPIWFHPPGGELLLLAGLYQPRPTGRAAFTILTTAANELVARVHDRMPCVLPRDRVEAWLQAPRLELLVPAPSELLVATEVSAKVNDVHNDDPTCLDPPDEKSKPQLRLF